MKNSLVLLLTVLAFSLLTSCSEKDCNPVLIPDCNCTTEYNPVCGCDDETYGNACVAECNSITDYREGECE